MTRIKRGYIARRRRTRIRLFASSFRGSHSRLTRAITQQKIRALVSAHRDRDKKKSNFRHLWITRINAVIRERGVSYSYSKLINDLYKRQLLLNRKILAQIAISNRDCLYMISNEIRKEVDWKEYTGII
jgi:large subunit ribosomal protein L20